MSRIKLLPQPVPKKKKYRKIISDLSIIIEENFGEWLKSFKYEIIHKNKIYQRRDAIFTKVRNVWRVKSGHFDLACGIYTVENNIVLTRI